MKYILTLSCPDRPGIVHAVTAFLLDERATILEAAQFDDASTGLFFSRIKFELLDTDHRDPNKISKRFEAVGKEFSMTANFAPETDRMPAIIMVSQLGHCLNDLLFRYRSGLLPINIRAIVSNHRAFEDLASNYGIPFHYIPVRPETKESAESELMRIFEQEEAQLLILARYMQILSDELCRRMSGRAINIHHSFLPSFKGARPYQQARDRGVKLIGATAHYVTGDLDEGPIIEQDVERADHAMTVEDLTNIGRDVESVVLARAVRWHAERRILLNGSKTVVFR
ncbi:formyltetrahydrofolate deformylase [Variovorax sp. GB1P17]|uniref:formyltetrahydrofolate deformylase n=1 Tax=Variovorax sp. GB1P17 TaxID=3443740 RepID=UPI003F4715E9